MNTLILYGVKGPLYLLIFLLPLFFLPFTHEIYEFNKLYLLYGLTLISLLSWLAKSVFIDKVIRIKRTPLFWGIAALFLSALLSSVFSRDIVTSVLGFYGRFSSSFVEMLLWLLLYALMVNTFTYEEAKKLCIPLFISASLLAILFHLSWTGILERIPLGPSPQLLAVFEAVVLSLMVGWFLVWGKKTWLPFAALAFLLMLSSVAVVSFYGSWIILLSSLVSLLIWYSRAKILPPLQTKQLMAGVIVIGVLCVASVLPAVRAFLPIDNAPLLNQSASWVIAQEVLKDGSFQSLVGTGLGNFVAAYNLYRPPYFNQAIEWARRFDNGSSHYLTTLATMGIVGALAWLSFMGLVGYRLYTLARHHLEPELFFYISGCIAVFTTLAVYHQTLGLSLVFWLFISLLALFLGKKYAMKEYRYTIGFAPEANIFATAGFFLALGAVAISTYFAWQFYVAQMLYAQGIQANTLEERLALSMQAVSRDPYRIQYRVMLAQTSLAKLTQDARAAGPAITNVAPFQELAKRAQEQADAVIMTAPQSVVAWESRGAIYTALRDIVFDAPGKEQTATLAMEAFQKAWELEPSNPVLPLQLGSLAMGRNDVKKADEFLTQAKRLKPDYVDVDFMRALLAEKQQKLDEAIAILEQLATQPYLSASFLQDVLFHLGRIAYNNNQLQKSVDALTKVIDINTHHFNAYYALGLTYERGNNMQGAREAYQKALELNPGNEDLKAKIERMDSLFFKDLLQ